MIGSLPEESQTFLITFMDRELGFIHESDVRSAETRRRRSGGTGDDEPVRKREMKPIPGYARRIKMHRIEQRYSISYLSTYADISSASLTLPRMDAHSTGIRKVLPLAILMGLSLDYLLGTGMAYRNIQDELLRRLYSGLQDLDRQFCYLIAECAIHESGKRERYQRFMTDREDT